MTAPTSRELERLALAVLQPGFVGTTLPDDLARLLDDGLGGVCLFDTNTTPHGGSAPGDPRDDQVTALCRRVHDLAPHAVIALDEEGGDVTRLHTADGSPHLAAAALGHADDLELTRATGAAVGAELAARDLDLVLGPVADVNSASDNPVIGTRSFGADPALVARHVVAWVAGAQASGVAACLKHFPGHGDTTLDSHVALPTVTADAETLRRRELVPFAVGSDAGVRAVMTSHLLLAALDPDRPATFSPTVLGLLRSELGFTGAIVTDALDMAGASAGPLAHNIPEAAVLALTAGADLLSLGPATPLAVLLATRDAVVTAVRDRRVGEQRLHEAAAQVARLRRDVAADAPQVSPPSAADVRRTLQVAGELPDLADALVVDLTTALSPAIGAIPRGVPADLDLAVDDPKTWDELDRQVARGRPLVVQVRDAHRHPGLLDRLDDLASATPLVLVEYGWPAELASTPHGVRCRVATHGGSAPAYAAVADLLTGAGWRGGPR